MNWFSMIHGLDEQKYERYLPTAFDESLTLLEKVNKVIETLNQIVLGVNTVADYVDGHVNTQNEKIKQLRVDFEVLKDWLENEGLEERTVQVLNEWFDNGRLAQIINNDVFNMKADKAVFEQFVLSTNTQLQQMEQDLTAQLQHFAMVVPENSDIDAINTIITTVHEKGGGNVYFPHNEYIITPTFDKTIVLKDNVNLIGNGKSRIKVSNNNPNFDSMIKGVGSKIQNVLIQGMTFDTNSENNNQNIGVSSRRLILHAELANNIRIVDCKFFHSGMNAILMTGAMYNHENFILTRSYFQFKPQGSTFYDNTAIYIGVIGHVITGNIFNGSFNSDFLKPRAVTCFESHSSYGVFENNIVSEYGSGVLVLGADYGTSDVTDKSLVQKNISNNIFRKMWNGITLWAGNRDVNHVKIDNNVIDINNKDRNRHSQNSYGIAFTHAMGGATMRNNIRDVSVTNNSIKFQEDALWLTNPPTDENGLYMGGFGIGAFGRTGETVSLKNITVESNTITNSPRQPFALSNDSVTTDQFDTVLFKRNTIINPFTTTGVSIDYRALLLLYGQNKNIVLEDNTVLDDREKPVLIREVFFRGNLTTFKNIRVMNNDFLHMDVALVSELPVFLRPANTIVSTPDKNKMRLLSSEDSMNGLTFNVNDGVMMRTSTGNPIRMCGKEGTNKTLLNGLYGSAAGNIVTIEGNIAIPFLAGEFIELRKLSDNTIIHATVRVLGVDRHANKIIISLNATGDVVLNYSKPAFVGVQSTP